MTKPSQSPSLALSSSNPSTPYTKIPDSAVTEETVGLIPLRPSADDYFSEDEDDDVEAQILDISTKKGLGGSTGTKKTGKTGKKEGVVVRFAVP